MIIDGSRAIGIINLNDAGDKCTLMERYASVLSDAYAIKAVVFAASWQKTIIQVFIWHGKNTSVTVLPVIVINSVSCWILVRLWISCKYWCSEHILGFTNRVRHTDLNLRYFARCCLTSHCVKSRLWTSMIFTPSLTYVLSYIFWKIEQNLWVGIFFIDQFMTILSNFLKNSISK